MPPVYSTATGRLCPECGQPVDRCQCRTKAANSSYPTYADGMVRLRRETKGRKGKGVTLVDGVGGTDAELRALAKKLKGHCGSGGTVREGIIEIQGDHREAVQRYLDSLGIKSKRAGG